MVQKTRTCINYNCQSHVGKQQQCCNSDTRKIEQQKKRQTNQQLNIEITHPSSSPTLVEKRALFPASEKGQAVNVILHHMNHTNCTDNDKKTNELQTNFLMKEDTVLARMARCMQKTQSMFCM